jgi:hypothetical protein
MNANEISDKSIIRTPHSKERPYFSMSRATAQDKRLSWEARGVLAYLLSKPDDWQVMVKDLQQNCGRDKVRHILDELKLHHYLKIIPRRNEAGKFIEGDYQVFETPFTENPLLDTSNRKPVTENPPLHNRESQKTDEIKKRGVPPRPTDPMADSMNRDLAAYIDAWRFALPGTPPKLPTGRQWTNSIDDAKELQSMGCKPEDVAAYTSERKANNKGTAWRFVVDDIHEYLNRKNGTPATPELAPPQTTPVDMEQYREQQAELDRRLGLL